MSTKEYLDKLTIDQLRFARDEADRRIKEAETKPKKILWCVTGTYGSVVEWYREEDYEKALLKLKEVIDRDCKQSMEEMIDERFHTHLFHAPKVEPCYKNEVEYEEYFN